VTTVAAVTQRAVVRAAAAAMRRGNPEETPALWIRRARGQSVMQVARATSEDSNEDGAMCARVTTSTLNLTTHSCALTRLVLHCTVFWVES
jgi:hypothetical protein